MATTTGDGSVYSNGFVFGKFYPLHKGHLALIRFAKSSCETLDVLVCGSSAELISTEVRCGWLERELSNEAGINIVRYCYDESHLPNTSVAHRGVSQVWSEVFNALFPRADLVVTSEPYGDYVAEYMNIDHMRFDLLRIHEPISATAIRKDLRKHWQYLPPTVQRHFQQTVVISGTESTGKTELARRLTDRYNAALVEEVGRQLIPDSTACTMADLHRVACQHAEAIQAAQSALAPLVIVDTDVYVTQSYAQFTFGQQLELPQEIYAPSDAHRRLYLDASVPHVQDGTRLPEQQRNRLDLSHRATLRAFNQPYLEITGSQWDRRYEAATGAIEPLLNPFVDHTRSGS